MLKKNQIGSDECLKIVVKIFSSMFINLTLGWFYLAIKHTDYNNNINILDWKSGTIYSYCMQIKGFLLVNWNSRNFNIQNFERELCTLSLFFELLAAAFMDIIFFW